MDTSLPTPSAAEVAHSARLADVIRQEIAARGPIPFARFMERCLYAPGLGYYSAGRLKFGAAGDFVTYIRDVARRHSAAIVQALLAPR